MTSYLQSTLDRRETFVCANPHQLVTLHQTLFFLLPFSLLGVLIHGALYLTGEVTGLPDYIRFQQNKLQEIV